MVFHDAVKQSRLFHFVFSGSNLVPLEIMASLSFSIKHTPLSTQPVTRHPLSIVDLSRLSL